MLKNNKFKYELKLAFAALLLVAFMLCGSACGTLDGMLDIFEGDNNASRDISHSIDVSDESDVSEEMPDTAAELFTSSSFGDGIMITEYTGTEPFVKIPAQINGKNVLAVGDKAIKDTKTNNGRDLYITTIILPATVTQIAFSAFSECKKLESLTVPFVGGRVDDHAYLGYVFGAYSAGDNKNAVPDSLQELNAGGAVVADEAFKDCENLKSIILKDVKSIGNSAFSGCTGLNTLFIPDTVSSIGDSAFNRCTSLVDLSLPFLGNGSDKLFLGAIFGAENYKQNQTHVPESLRNLSISCPSDIPVGAFYECNNIRSISIKGTVNSIGEEAFYRCRKLKKLEISPIKQLSPYAFAYCAALGELSLAEDITSIPDGAFYACSALRTLNFGNAVNAMPNSVKNLGKAAFAYCESLTAIELSSSLTHIEEQAFYGCAYLLSLTLPDTVTEVKDDAFKGCSNLKSLSLGTGLKSIGNGAFSYCSSLKELDISANVTTFGEYAFAYCSYLSDVSIACEDAKLGEGVFTGCKKIVISVDPDSKTYQSLIEAGLGNSNLKAPE